MPNIVCVFVYVLFAVFVYFSAFQSHAMLLSTPSIIGNTFNKYISLIRNVFVYLCNLIFISMQSSDDGVTCDELESKFSTVMNESVSTGELTDRTVWWSERIKLDKQLQVQSNRQLNTLYICIIG